MPGYNPRCDNCARCATCRGDGTIMTTVSDRGPGGKTIVNHKRVTCPTRRGVGGKPMAGNHNHS